MRRLFNALSACAWLALACAAQAQGPVPTPALRDPTVAPAAAGLDGAAADGATMQTSPVGTGNVVVRGGKPYLVVGSRLVAPGQTVDNYKLERITETEIWLRDASGLTKQPRFAGVQRSVASARCGTTAPTKSPSTRKKKPRTGATSPPESRSSPDAGAAPRPNRENDAHDC
ncbi:hypothetical protein RQP54_04980 [Curvibacter sp. APW13]|uniref:hypothetical protein n=1 Tax=Curvibacter sp. APW13 TaxID=3077236 RepID=UPI0028E08C6D|nr:hypothetical protein [Curvibacter sp. APW13]MDT8990212.1 hypothetical protein [Curvibacter sp. APW13]